MPDRVKPIECVYDTETGGLFPAAAAATTDVPLLAIDRRDLDPTTMPARAVRAAARAGRPCVIDLHDPTETPRPTDDPDGEDWVQVERIPQMIAAYVAALREDE